MMTTIKTFILLCALSTLSACFVAETEIEKWEVRNLPEQVEVFDITKKDFERQVGSSVTVEGIAVNSKPYCYVDVGFFVYLPTDKNFFWPPYLLGKTVRVTGEAVVLRPTGRIYSRVDLAPKKYFLEAVTYKYVED